MVVNKPEKLYTLWRYIYSYSLHTHTHTHIYIYIYIVLYRFTSSPQAKNVPSNVATRCVLQISVISEHSQT
jgi:hypothetical protein